jgi:TPR repeat protein
VEWYQRAAAQGNGDAMLSLALMFDAGEGVAVDKATALQWYERAAQSGIAQACGNLAAMYLTGTDVEQNPFTGLVWSLLSVRAGQRSGDSNQSHYVQQWEMLTTKLTADLRAQVEAAANDFAARHWR